MSYIPIKTIKVSLQMKGQPIEVGNLAYHNHSIYFEYKQNFINTGIEISPFKLPLSVGLLQSDSNLFEGLPGVFNDSLPDGWGKLLLDRAVRTYGILPTELTPLDRLAYVGRHGMGALIYEPSSELKTSNQGKLDLDKLAVESQHILHGDSDRVIEEMLILNGSSTGARPKAMIGLNKQNMTIIYGIDDIPKKYEHWLVKFPNSSETIDSGAIEYAYAEMAKLAGIDMMEAQLLNANKGPGYFATKRFDREKNQRFHVHSVCGLLDSDFRTPSMDYKDLLKVTEILTQEKTDVIKLFKQAVFNVLAHNYDDHTKNISFIMDESGQWHLAPAYDLTFSSGLGGEQSTMVMGKGKDITIADLVMLGASASISKKEVLEIIDQVKAALMQWKVIATAAGVGNDNIKNIL